MSHVTTLPLWHAEQVFQWLTHVGDPEGLALVVRTPLVLQWTLRRKVRPAPTLISVRGNKPLRIPAPPHPPIRHSCPRRPRSPGRPGGGRRRGTTCSCHRRLQRCLCRRISCLRRPANWKEGSYQGPCLRHTPQLRGIKSVYIVHRTISGIFLRLFSV